MPSTDNSSLPLRERILTSTAVGTFLGVPTAMSAEIVARGGWDLVCIDAEHGGVGLETIDAMIRGAEAAGVPAIVRVPEVGPEIARVLDLGAIGILVPRVETAAQAEEAVDRARFAPLGSRGAGPGRASKYGYAIPEYVDTANDRIVVAVQIETAAGLANVAEITAVAGIDVVFVGPIDLAVSLGVALGSPEHEAAMRSIFDHAERAGVARAAFCMTPEALTRTCALTRLGFVLVGGDFVFLAQTAADTLHAARAALASQEEPALDK